MKTYRGNPAAARAYVEAGRARADEYYLAEGTGIAARYEASPDSGVRELAPLSGEKYEAWVAGVDPDTGMPKGQLRHDENAVRFVELIVNGPKSWSLAAALHDDISAAYDAAQDAAARQIIAWLAQHATTRVGPRGYQIQIPVDHIEAAVIRHHSSRAGDPHRHLHLQINARVRAEGTWRGLHTVGVRDSLDALNGIGHAAVMTDPGFRAALARHGYTLDPDSGEIGQLAPFVGPFSARAAQIGRNLDRYEAAWRTTNPGREPGPRLRQSWDRRAWAEARPDKIAPRDGAAMTAAWVTELRELGYRAPRRPSSVVALPVGRLDRDQAVADVLQRLEARRSAWNAADVRGQIEHLVARHNIVADPAIRGELAEDLTARTLAACVPLIERPGLPEHVRSLTSRHVLAVEADLASRFARRGAARVTPDAGDRLTQRLTEPRSPAALGLTDFETPSGDAVDMPTGVLDGLDLGGLDRAQRDVVAALAGDNALVVVEGAAGAGKTTTLAAARAVLAADWHRLVVVTPTLKAARVAQVQVGAGSSSAARLAHRHGYRWSDSTGAWTRLAPGQTDPGAGASYPGPDPRAVLRPGDVLLVDEAGMLDQDTALALLTIADETGARVALVGDRHQLPAVGRGGVLDLAARHAPLEACLTLATVHRFADPDYAELTLAMRAGEDPGAVFDQLAARGQIRLHPSEPERRHALAAQAADAIAAGRSSVWLADTREQVTELNAAIRDRLVAAGRVDDQNAATTAAGQRVGVGDRVATRRNDPALRVANRDSWTITNITSDETVTVAGEQGHRILPAAYVREHVELAYATTVYGAQGDTTTAAHLVLGEHTSAAAAYVGMTRGRDMNTAHLVADSLDNARAQWVEIFTRDRADLGPAHAAHLVEREAVRYTELRPLDDVVRDLRQAWTAEADTRELLTRLEPRRDALAELVALREERRHALAPLTRASREASDAAEAAARRAEQVDAAVAAHATDIAADLQRAWDEQRAPAHTAAATVRAGSGLLAHRRGAVRHAAAQLSDWAASWRPYLRDMPAGLDQIVERADGFDNEPAIRAAFDQCARAAAEQAHPGQAAARAAATTAQARAGEATQAWAQLNNRYHQQLSRYGSLVHLDHPEHHLAELEQHLTQLRQQAATARKHLTDVLADPTLRIQPAERIHAEHDRWHAARNADRDRREQQRRTEHHRRMRAHQTAPTLHRPSPSRGISR